jgi:hypothetical protein
MIAEGAMSRDMKGTRGVQPAKTLPPHPATVVQAKRPHAAQSASAPGGKAAHRPAAVQAMMGPARSWSVEIAPKGRKATLTFVSPEGKEVPFETEIGIPDLKVFLKHIGHGNVQVGKSAPNLTIAGVDEKLLLGDKVRGDVIKLINGYLVRLNAPVPTLGTISGRPISHGAAVALLAGLTPSKPRSGHPSIQMAVIVLPCAYTLLVAGQARPITHLYTQVIERREARCYLGDEQGAYQRVHTSLTNDDSAHTMVQICPKVIIPGYNDHVLGTRTGFDLFGSSLWLSQRKLNPRSKAQCSVKGSIDGIHVSELGFETRAGCELMALFFNQVLESVLFDLLRASNVAATFISSDFTILDTVWLLHGEQETPVDYYKGWKARRRARKQYERLQKALFEQEKAELFDAAIDPTSTYEDSLRYRRFAASDLPEI